MGNITLTSGLLRISHFAALRQAGIFFLRERIMGYLNVCLLVFFLALPCNAAYYEEPPQITQCRQSIIDATSVPGGGTSYTYPQKCGLLQAYRNIYNPKENVIGEFTARSCGECASVCVAHAFGGYKNQVKHILSLSLCQKVSGSSKRN